MASYPRNTERRNCSKLSMAIVDLSSDVLRVILDSHTKPQDLANKVGKFKPSEILRINEAANDGSYKKFDISFLYKILRCVCNQDIHDFISKQIAPAQINNALQNDSEFKASITEKELNKLQHIIKTGIYDGLTEDLLHKLYTCTLICNPLPQLIHPSKGWGNTPDENDRELGDDIERIRIIRNVFHGHIPSTEIHDTDFESIWNQLDSIMKNMNTRLQLIRGNKDFKNDLDKIYSSILSEEEKRYCIDEINRLAEFEKELAKRIDETELKLHDLAIDTNKKHELLYDRMANFDDEITQTNDKRKEMENTLEDRNIRQEVLESDMVGLKKGISNIEGTLQTVQEDVSNLKEQAKGSIESSPQRRESTPAEEVYDVLIFHASDDRPDAIDFCTDIEEKNKDIKPNIILCDDFALDIQCVFETMGVVFDRCIYLFVYVTDNFTETDLERYQLKIALVDSIKNKKNNNRIIPIWACTDWEKKVKELSPLRGVKYMYMYIKNGNNESVMKNIRDLITIGRKSY